MYNNLSMYSQLLSYGRRSGQDLMRQHQHLAGLVCLCINSVQIFSFCFPLWYIVMEVEKVIQDSFMIFRFASLSVCLLIQAQVSSKIQNTVWYR